MNEVEARLRNVESVNLQSQGLSEEEAEKRRREFGPNLIIGKKKISPIKILVSQFTDFMVLILICSTVISAFLGELTEALTILAIVVMNALLGFMQEYKTERTMEALKKLTAPTSRVLRGGSLMELPAEAIVPGDLLVLEAGDRVPADALIAEGCSLEADESLLTGESIPVEKHGNGRRPTTEESGTRNNCLYMGTIITKGRATATAFSTGMRTEMGKIAELIQDIEDEDTPLKRKLNHLGKYLVGGCLVICAIVSGTGLIRGEPLFNMLLSGISLAVAAIPEGLPAIVTISLTLGVQRMLKRKALVRRLPAVETLGCADVICSDKTGTLTQNKMAVRSIFVGGRMVHCRDEEKKGFFFIDGQGQDPSRWEALRLLLQAAAVCNNATLEGGLNHDEPSGDPTEIALLLAAVKGGLREDMISRRFKRLDELPFDSDRKAMSVVCRSEELGVVLFTKGAPDMLLKKCTGIYGDGGVTALSEIQRRHILKQNAKMAGEALRVLGVAFKRLPSGRYDKSNLESGLIFLGLIGMMDPPRREAVGAVDKCLRAGIRPVMITGDHKLTALAVAKELRIHEDGDGILTGDEMDAMDDRELEGMIAKTTVYARVSPRHKLAIVRALKKQGHIVAMTGDGVNDAPAVKEADIGISMGVTGTDVTKEASAMILTDDNFATIVSAVEEGRVIYENIRKFIRYMLSCNIGEVLTMFLAALLGMPIPLLPIQILWVNLVTDGLPAIALGLDPAERDIMQRPPRGTGESIFSRGLLSLILIRGALIGITTLSVFSAVMAFTPDERTARTAAFVTLVVTQLVHVFECKSERRSIFEIPLLDNIPLILSVACSLLMLLGVVYIPHLQGIFKTVALSGDEWMLILGFSALGPVFSSFFKKR